MERLSPSGWQISTRLQRQKPSQSFPPPRPRPSPQKLKQNLPKAKPRLPPKPKLLRSNPFRITSIILLGKNPLEVDVGDDVLHVGYSKRETNDLIIDGESINGELSDYVKLRLLIARLKALQRFDIVRGKNTFTFT